MRNPRDAAAKAGYSLNPQAAALKLLNRAEIQKEIADIQQKQNSCKQEAAAGFRRLAFGSVADALSLIFCEEIPDKEELGKMDLFNVAEIKRPKGGGLEIKFFDRLKPLERLSEIDTDEVSSSALPFYSALDSSAKALYGRGADE